MAADTPSDVTCLLEAIRAGDGQARNRLVELVYGELHQVAARLLRGAPDDNSLQPTALLHEALIRLLDGQALARAPNRAYFFGAVARAMQNALADHARRRRAAKRGGNLQRVPLDAMLAAIDERGIDTLALHEALKQLAVHHERAGQVVTLRFIGGFTVEEVAQQLEISPTTAESDFRFARAWLRKKMGGGDP
jgi:RNA polymerase sigma-70 factor (ECF subfamily)